MSTVYVRKSVLFLFLKLIAKRCEIDPWYLIIIINKDSSSGWEKTVIASTFGSKKK